MGDLYALDPPLYFDKRGDPIDLATWAKLFGDLTYVRLARTTVGTVADDVPVVVYDVVTFWGGIDRAFGTGPRPLIFETLVLCESDADATGFRYATEAEAMQGHNDTVTWKAATVTDPVLMDSVGSDWGVLVARASGDHG